MFEFLKKKEIPERSFVAVTSGYLMPLEKVKDEAFASKMLGEGVAIRPDGEYVVAPCRGTISMLYPTLHAFGIRSDEGVDILIHIGIDTVKFKGKGFKALKAQNDTVEPGDKIIRFDSYMMDQEKMDMTVMMLFPSFEEKLDVKTEGHVTRGRDIVACY